MSTIGLDRGRIAVLGMLAAFGAVSIDMYLPAMPTIARDLAVDVGSVQLTLSVSTAAGIWARAAA